MQEAWHVGDINDHSIGIEITGADGQALLNNTAQFNSVVQTATYLCSYYNIPCGNPIGDITGDHNDPEKAQGMLGHSEAPNPVCGDTCNHSDPDTKIVNGTAYNITTGKVWTDADRSDSSIHAYMMKLRTVMGLNPTPGKSGSSGSSGASASTSTTSSSGSCSSGSQPAGNGTAIDPVGDGPNKALALVAVQYATAVHPQYTYVYGANHGSLAQLEQFQNGGQVDCSSFVRFVIWKTYGVDVGANTAQGFVDDTKHFEKIDPSQVAAGDMGVIDTTADQHIDFITQNLGGGQLHEFGAHDPQDNLKGGAVSASNYTYFIRYIGPQGSVE
jgi:hypothetical protein